MVKTLACLNFFMCCSFSNGKLYLQVFSFGSVPLKTYLPDGDIDLTVLTKRNMEDEFFEKLYDTLKSEEGKSEFHVTDVQFIPAQVCLFAYFILVSVLCFKSCSIKMALLVPFWIVGKGHKMQH